MIRTDRLTRSDHCGYAAERIDACIDGPRDRPLDALRGSRSADRFRVWTGRSGRRYVFSVFAFDGRDAEPDRSLLTSEAVVIAVARSADGARAVLWVGLGGPSPEGLAADRRVRVLAGGGECELHLHFLASER